MDRRGKRLVQTILSVAVVLTLGLLGLAAALASFHGLPDEPSPNRIPSLVSGVSGPASIEPGMFDGSWRATVEQEFENSLAPTRVFRVQWTRFVYLLFAQALPGVHIGSSGYLFTREEWYEDPQDFQFQPDSITAISAAAESLRSRGIQLVVALVPAKNRILGEYARSRLSDRLSRRYQTAMGQVSSVGIQVVDLETAFQSHPQAGSLYMRTDTHWSPEGARTAAIVLAGFINKRGLLDAVERMDFTTQSGGTEPFQGDLFEFLPLPTNADTLAPVVRFGPLSRPLPGAESLARYATSPTASSGSSLFDTPVIPVALVGTSYSAGADWNFAGFLMEALRADVLNLAQPGTGPFEPMSALLRDPGLQELGIRLVIWEIPERYLLP